MQEDSKGRKRKRKTIMQHDLMETTSEQFFTMCFGKRVVHDCRGTASDRVQEAFTRTRVLTS